MIDSHAHIYLEHFREDLDQVLENCSTAGVANILMPNIDHTSIDAMMEVEAKNPSDYIPMIGLHPCSVKKDFEKELYLVEEWLQKRKFIAIGEMGTDLYWDKTFWAQQQEAFKVQSEFGLRFDLPIVIHSRESMDETIDLVRPFAEKGLKGVFHCFTGDVSQAKQIMELGFYLGIGGVATFKNGGLDKVLPEIGSKKLLLETDSPYLAPVPYRGKRNEPSYLKLIRNRIADILEQDPGEIENRTVQNTRELFRL